MSATELALFVSSGFLLFIQINKIILHQLLIYRSEPTRESECAAGRPAMIFPFFFNRQKSSVCRHLQQDTVEAKP